MSTSSSDEDGVNSEMVAAAARRERRKHYMRAAHVAVMYGEKFLTKRSRRVPVMTGQQWVTENLSTNKDCYAMFRMYRPVFDRLHATLLQNYGLESTRNMSSEECLGMFLWTVGSPQSVSQVENRFKRSTEVIHRKFHHVLDCLNKMAVDNIKPTDPDFRVVHERLRGSRFAPHFDKCIGAIDGSHVPVVVPSEEIVNHVGRHGYPTQNIMGVCDFDMRFTSVVAGWPGSAHDTRIFKDTLVKYADKFPHPPKDRYYLVDSGYPNCEGYLAPYKSTKYHVPEFLHGEPPSGKNEIYNHAHSSLRNVIERAFGVLKMKWRILLNMPSYPCEKQALIIIACMALHNFIRDSHLRDKEFDRCDRDENYMPGNLQPPPAGHVSNIVHGDDALMKETRERIADGLFAAAGGV